MSDPPDRPGGPPAPPDDGSPTPAPNANTLWARILVAELVASGVTAACIAPGSRSTPLTLAFVDRDDVRVFSHLDERSAAFFALGRAKRTGEPTALVCTSGTAAANFHPAVIEANQSRTPLVVCTADRPPELRDSGANQTIDQAGLYGDAVRFGRTLAEPEADARKLRSLRVVAGRAVAASTRTPAGPVHLNVPFRKPLEPTPVPDDVPEGFAEDEPLAANGRDGPFVATNRGPRTVDEATMEGIADAIRSADRGLIVAGPADPVGTDPAAIGALAEATGFPVLADPLSGLRFGPSTGSAPTCGGYDAYLAPGVTDDWPDPDLVLRFGASPTSKVLRAYLERTGARQFLVDPAGGWREATFAASDLVEADPGWLAPALGARLGQGPAAGGDRDWADRFREAEAAHWSAVEAETRFFEGAVLAAVVDEAPDPATLFVSNSMPVRDLDRFGRPREADLTVLGNRGASGIDGITSTALGAGSTTDEPLVLVTGDLAYYHDMNGLLALTRCGVDATVVLIDNDGGGIFHMLPIADHGAFEDWFETPHGLDFSPTADLYDLEFDRVDTLGDFRAAYGDSVDSAGTQVISVESDAEAGFEVREALAEEVRDALAGD